MTEPEMDGDEREFPKGAPLVFQPHAIGCMHVHFRSFPVGLPVHNARFFLKKAVIRSLHSASSTPPTTWVRGCSSRAPKRR